jgi:hypothetical protein
MQSLILHYTDAVLGLARNPEVLVITAAHRLAFDGDFSVTNRQHGEQQRAAESTDRCAQRHEVRGFEMYDAIVVTLDQVQQLDGGEMIAVHRDQPEFAPAAGMNPDRVARTAMLFRRRQVFVLNLDLH